jgi:hypothetical protein
MAILSFLAGFVFGPRIVDRLRCAFDETPNNFLSTNLVSIQIGTDFRFGIFISFDALGSESIQTSCSHGPRTRTG